MGGEAAVKKQHDRGKLTARERIDLLFDPGTFRETDIFMKHRGTLFGLDKLENHQRTLYILEAALQEVLAETK